MFTWGGPTGEAKFWLEPTVRMVWNRGLRRNDLSRALRIIRERENEIRKAWEEPRGRRGDPHHR